MDRWRREALRSANSGLRNQVERLLDSYEQQHSRFAEINQQLENVRVQADSADRSVTATVDAGGELTDLSLSAAALRKPAAELVRTIVEATQEAARRARRQSEAAAASVAADLDDQPDLSDILDESPTLRDIREFFRGTDRSAGGAVP
ncbi:YbaB/EbfC family nucleoid-associated protein [Nocardia sp. BSTN01]|uniref:YbaB/EbfC family nucleoid-associated protein n=1 Tax=Nocardia sp. BSTN01 TaxID=2783665 RepID=UPI00188F7240|nr:YbaB/EbfC family nucleoid-associated protein [Nocardia sp. BSTN01]MBF4996506.1 YbaB/EbfC family nucleoid-associated protein [Nocardia sp. BSTN01]